MAFSSQIRSSSALLQACNKVYAVKSRNRKSWDDDWTDLFSINASEWASLQLEQEKLSFQPKNLLKSQLDLSGNPLEHLVSWMWERGEQRGGIWISWGETQALSWAHREGSPSSAAHEQIHEHKISTSPAHRLSNPTCNISLTKSTNFYTSHVCLFFF